jgi:hypothetical protein
MNLNGMGALELATLVMGMRNCANRTGILA